jgi:hypothetical protein
MVMGEHEAVQVRVKMPSDVSRQRRCHHSSGDLPALAAEIIPCRRITKSRAAKPCGGVLTLTVFNPRFLRALFWNGLGRMTNLRKQSLLRRWPGEWWCIYRVTPKQRSAFVHQ